MKKISLAVLSAAFLLTACGGKAPAQRSESSVSQEVVSSEQSSREASSEDVSEAVSEVSEVSEESIEEVTEEVTEEVVESSEEIIESSEEVIESTEENVESSEEIIVESSEEVIESSEELIVNDGSLEYPFTVSEGYAIAVELEPGTDAGAQYFIKGIVSGEISFYKGRVSFDLVDEDSTLYVYNMNNSENKASYKNGEYDFKVGDEIIVAGTFKNYVKDDVSKLEICYVKDVANCYKAG